MNDKQRRFVEEYLIDLNATQAAIRSGYSAKTAEQQGSRLLSNANISDAVNAAKQKRSEATGITASWVLTEAEDLYRECRREGDRSNAKGTLDMIGKHISVQAFKELRELSGHLSLGQALDDLDG